MPRLAIALALAGTLAAGCGGRDARPIPTQQSFDPDMSCPQLAAELDSNKKSINRLNGELGDLDGQNAAVVVGVLLAGPGVLFALDDGEAQKQEIAAFQTRNNRLTELAAARDCGDLAALAPAGGAAVAVAPAKTGDGALAAQPSTTASAGSTTSTAGAEQAAKQAAEQAAAEQAAAQAEFDAWLERNRERLLEQVNSYVRANNLHEAMVGVSSVDALQGVEVVRREGENWIVDVTYYLRRAAPSAAYQSINPTDRFRLELEDGRLIALDLAA